MGFFSILILAMIVLDICWWILADKWLRASRSPWLLRLGVAAWSIFMIGNVALHVLPAVTSAKLQNVMNNEVLAAVFIWNMLAAPIGCVAMVLAGGMTRLIFKKKPGVEAPADVEASTAAEMDRESQAETELSSGEVRFTRREMIGMAATSVAPLILAGSTVKSTLDLERFNVEHRDLVVTNLPHELESLTIVHVSDIHHGRFTDQDFLDRIGETVNLMNADLVLWTGDLIDHNLRDLPMVAKMAGQVRSNYGSAFCVGNHDLFEDRDQFIKSMHANHLELLVDEQMDKTIRGRKVRLVGLDYGRGPSGMPAKSAQFLENHDPSVFSIALAHHPHAFDLTAKAGIPVTLSGHTHGGQLMFTPHVGLGSMAFRYWSGLYRQGSSALVVSNGVGNWFPLRVNAPAEIVKLTLKRA